MERKKSACTLLITILILGVAIVSVSTETQQPKLFVDPPTYTAALLGEVFVIDIKIANVTGLYCFEFRLGYNTTLLDVLDAVEGPFPPISAVTIEIHEQEGHVLVYGSCEPAEGNGTMATITFSVTYAASASCTLDIQGDYLYDMNVEPIPHDTEDGNYTFAILGVTVATNKPYYHQGKNVTIHGNLTLNGSPHQGLVAVEVDDPDNFPHVVRTVQTGSTFPPEEITILEVVPCDKDGNPKSSFKRGAGSVMDLFYVRVTVKNNSTEGKDVTVTANSYDVNMVSLGVTYAQDWPLGSGASSSYVLSISIPEWASLGTGTVYVNAYTDWPGYGFYGDHPKNGTPYCPEKNATFEIINSPQGAGAPETQSSGDNSTVGNYSLNFKLRLSDLKLGNYTVYASSSYRGQQVINSTTFEVRLFGDVNGDGKISYADVYVALRVYSGTWPYPAPGADLNGDGKITYADVYIVLRVYSGTWPLP